ncbi:hypothetical protein BDW22DRAFT_1358401 [Trametopsis cervina]|nr:hypothetical protein BDW22DRAFT_1358401 [Trametopsis cervina]
MSNKEPRNRHAQLYSGEVRKSLESVRSHQTFDETASIAESFIAPLPEPKLPDLDLPQSEFDFESILSSVIASPEPETEKVNKRASNVLKLAQENAKLQEELKAMNARLEAAERRQAELRRLEAEAAAAAAAKGAQSSDSSSKPAAS